MDEPPRGGLAHRLAARLSAACAPLAVRVTARALNMNPGGEPERSLRRLFSDRGFHLLRKGYYQPIPEQEEIGPKFQDARSALPGLDMNDAAALGLLDQVFPRHAEEFRALVPLHAAPGEPPPPFHLINGTFMAVDAQVYHAFIRLWKPARIVEIGGGNSSVLAALACARNREETGTAPRLTVIEPYAGPALRQRLGGAAELVEARVQDVDIGLFTSLCANDILFIDSSHVLRPGGDVQMEYLEILPRLSPGVLVHVHDVSLPKPYPPVYFGYGWYWTEQYLLQAFLAFNSRFEVLWPGNHMILRYPDRVLAAFPEVRAMREKYPESEPTSFWMRVRP